MALKTLRIVTKKESMVRIVKELNPAGGETEYQEKIKLQTVGAPLNAASNQTSLCFIFKRTVKRCKHSLDVSP